jgi:platelet-activating factor acetylhydrolase
VARTCASDLVDGAHVDKLDVTKQGNVQTTYDGLCDDKAIFDRSGDSLVDHWQWIDIIGMGEAGEVETGKSVAEQVEDNEQKMESEIEPAEQISKPLELPANMMAV